MNNTKMSGVWTPSEAPPRLDKFCHLSLDAQRVMAALYSDFHQRKAEMTAARACTSGITDPQNYYRTIYEAKFGKSLEDSYEQAQRPSMITNTSTHSVVPSHNSQLSTPFNDAFNKKSSKYFQMDVTHKPARKLIFSEGSTPCLVSNESKTNNAVSTGNVASASIFPDIINQRSAPTSEQLSPDISNYSDSPPVETQDFRLLSQMNRQEGYLHVDSVARTSNSPTVDYSTYEANNGQGLCAEDKEDSYSIKNKDWAVSEMHCEVTSPSACYSSKSNLGSKRNFSSNLDIWSVNNDIPHVGELIDSHILNDINSSLHTNFVEEEVEYPKFEILGKNEFSFSPVSSKKPSENLQKNTDIIYIEALDGLFNQNLTVSTDVNSTCNSYALDSSKVLDIEEHWMHQGMQDESPFVHEINTLNVSFQRSKTCAKKIPGFLDKMLPEMQDQHKSSNESNKSLNPRQSSSNSSECESPFVDKQVPLYPMFEKRSNGSAATGKRKIGDSTKFVVPLKKTKPDTISDQGAYPTTDFSARHKVTKEIVYISEESSDTVSSHLHTILNASTVVISLVYTDNTTQLREDLFGQDSKKRLNVSKKKKTDVGYFAVSPMGVPGNNVFLFPAEISDQRMFSTCRDFWGSLLSSESVQKIGFQAKDFLKEMLKLFGLDTHADWLVLDSSVGWWLLDPDNPVSSFQHLLSSLSMPQQAPNESSLTALPSDMALLNAAMIKLQQKLQCRELWPLFQYIESRLIPILAAMELRSLTVATKTLLHFSELLKNKMSQLEKQAHKAAGRPVLLSSHAQLRQVLFEELKLDTKLPGNAKLARTSVGRETSTSEAVLTQLIPFHPLPAIILEHRQIQKLKSTYIDGMLSCVSDSSLYTHWDQTAASTGRVTSYQPNIQAIPKVPVTITYSLVNCIPDKCQSETVEIYARDAFTSQDGYTLVAADFQQIELRLLGHLSNDEALIRLFSEPDIPDIFNALTAQWLGKSVETVSSAEREQTKRVVYSIMYGVGREKLAEYLKIGVDNAKAIMASFLVKFPAVGNFTKSCVDFCHKNGYTLSLLKRRRLFPNIHSNNYTLRAQTERQCVNFCVQGSAADICKVAMLGVEDVLRKNSHLYARLLVQIHDELLVEVADNHLSAVIDLVKSVMEQRELLTSFGVKLRIPIPVSISTGKKWGHMVPVQQGDSKC